MVGEAKLEMFLEENPPIESNIPKACASLDEAKSYLTELVSESSTQVKYCCFKLFYIIYYLLNKINIDRHGY